MPDTPVPDRIDIPLEIAESIGFGGDATARDISYAVLVGWMAGQRDESLDGTPVEIGDNALRLALGRTRRSSIEIEEERIYRMTRSVIARDTMGDVVPMPSLTFRLPDGRVVINRNGEPKERDKQLRWNVDRRVGDTFRVLDDEPVVQLPTRLLQFAKFKATVPLMLRVLAWCAGSVDRRWIKEQDDRWLVLRIPYARLLEALGLSPRTREYVDYGYDDEPAPAPAVKSPRMKPAVLMERILGPSCAEITELTGFDITAHPIHTVYRPRLGAGSGKTEGKIKEIELRIAMPAPEPITVLPGRVPGKTWKRKPAYKRIRTAKTPAKVDNVVPLSNPTPAIASNATESARTKLDPVSYKDDGDNDDDMDVGF